MTTICEDDTAGEQYDRDVLDTAAVSTHSALFDYVESHPEEADFENLREQLHEMVDEAVDDLEAER